MSLRWFSWRRGVELSPLQTCIFPESTSCHFSDPRSTDAVLATWRLLSFGRKRGQRRTGMWRRFSRVDGRNHEFLPSTAAGYRRTSDRSSALRLEGDPGPHVRWRSRDHRRRAGLRRVARAACWRARRPTSSHRSPLVTSVRSKQDVVIPEGNWPVGFEAARASLLKLG